MKQNWQPDSEQFQSNNKGKAAQEFNLLGVGAGALGSKRVRNEMLNQEQPDGNDSGQ